VPRHFGGLHPPYKWLTSALAEHIPFGPPGGSLQVSFSADFPEQLIACMRARIGAPLTVTRARLDTTETLESRQAVGQIGGVPAQACCQVFRGRDPEYFADRVQHEHVFAVNSVMKPNWVSRQPRQLKLLRQSTPIPPAARQIRVGRGVASWPLAPADRHWRISRSVDSVRIRHLIIATWRVSRQTLMPALASHAVPACICHG
jgi:hypothetical protein